MRLKCPHGRRLAHGARRHVAARVAEADAAVVPSEARPKVSMVSLGCPKNTVDGEVMLGHLEQSGFDVTRDHEESDAIIVNTCAFVEDAKSESLDVILQAAELRAQREGKRVFVTGCMAQRYGADLSEQLPEVDGIVGFERYGELPATLRATLAQPPDVDAAPAADLSGERVRVGQATVPFRPEGRRFRLTPPHTAYLRVAEGCDHACTFCAIPGFRGKFRSKAFDSVLSEARMLVAEGVVELNLIAEDTNQYGMDKKGGPGLAELLADLAEIEGLRWIRILYAYPSYFSEELIDEIARNDKVCKYIDIPLQHMSNLTLLAMNRPPRAYTEGLLRKLRERIPGLVLRTTFIAGFPGETDAQHRELVDFCKSFRFDRMGAFAYSQEDGTAAFNLPEQVDEDTAMARRDELVSLQQSIGEDIAKSMVGRTIEVLVDGDDEEQEGIMIGRTQGDAPDIDHAVLLNNNDDPDVPPLEAGQIRDVHVTGNITFDLVGYPVS